MIVKARIPKNRLAKIQKLKRKKFHPALHHAHKEHRMSYKTLYYIKSYGKDRHLWHSIVKQSIKILILASILSTIGGLWLEGIQQKLLLTPLIILLPALNDMIGDFGTIIGSKFTTMLFLKKTGDKWWKSGHVHSLVVSVLSVAVISAVYIGLLSSAMSVLQGYQLSQIIAMKVLAISLLSTVLLIGLICIISFVGGLYIFKKGEDPNNFLVPITTSVADLGSLIIFSLLVVRFF